MKIPLKQKINPKFWLGNLDDPNPPADYRPEVTDRKRRLYWALRNPLHNFTFYTIGIADKDFTSTGKHPDAVFSPEGGWNFAMRKSSWISLPFISYKGKVKFYAGWRERGNLGFKLTGNKDNK